jgi:obg-like ATPase 1
MPPKKVVEEEKLGPWALGRFSSNLKVRVLRGS